METNKHKIKRVNILLKYKPIIIYMKIVGILIILLTCWLFFLYDESDKNITLPLVVLLCSILNFFGNLPNKPKKRYTKINYNGLNNLYYDEQYSNLIIFDNKSYVVGLSGLSDKDEFRKSLNDVMDNYIIDNTYSRYVNRERGNKTYTIED